MTEAKIQRFGKEGRGRGHGVDYKPWLTVHDLSSMGQVSRMLGRHNARVHHLFSNIETATFMEYDWRDDVVDIQEQFPLDRVLTRQIAASLGVVHPRDPHSGVDVVMTTDLVVTFDGGDLRPIASKASGDLLNIRVREKLEIERLYWVAMHRDWKLRTERSFDKVRVQNLAYLYEVMREDTGYWVDPRYWLARRIAFVALLRRTHAATPFVQFATAFDRLPGFGPGDSVRTMRFLACHKIIGFDLRVKFDHTAPIGRSIELAERRSIASAA
jgi:hypothetical protein